MINVWCSYVFIPLTKGAPIIGSLPDDVYRTSAYDVLARDFSNPATLRVDHAVVEIAGRYRTTSLRVTLKD